MDDGDREAGLAPLYLLLVLPVLLLYRSLQEMPYQGEVVVVHLKDIESPAKLKEKRVPKIRARHPKKEDDSEKIVSIPNQESTTSWSWPQVVAPTWPQIVAPSWPQVGTRPNPPTTTLVPSSQQTATNKSRGFAGKLARLSRKVTKKDKSSPRHQLVATKKPDKVLWLRARLARLGRKQISLEVAGEPIVQEMQETPRKKDGKMKNKFSRAFKKLPAMISKLSRASK